MNRILKIIAYLAIAFVLSYLANNGCRDFIKGLSDNIISLLATILAINIPTSTLIISEINKIKDKFSIDPSPAFKELRHGLIAQIFVLCSLIVILIGCDFIQNMDFITSWKIHIISGTFVLASLIYYLEVIYDLGIALFKLIDFKANKKE